MVWITQSWQIKWMKRKRTNKLQWDKTVNGLSYTILYLYFLKIFLTYKYRYVLTFLKTFLDCTQLTLYCMHYLCVPLFLTYTTITTTIICKQKHLFIRSVLRKSSNRDCSLYTLRIFTQDWLNYYCPSSTLFWLFIVLRNSLTNVLNV